MDKQRAYQRVQRHRQSSLRLRAHLPVVILLECSTTIIYYIFIVTLFDFIKTCI